MLLENYIVLLNLKLNAVQSEQKCPFGFWILEIPFKHDLKFATCLLLYHTENDPSWKFLFNECTCAFPNLTFKCLYILTD